MNQIKSTGPGFYAAETTKGDPTIPPNTLRMYFARIEVYDGDAFRKDFDQASFTLLPAKAKDDPLVAKALLKLHETLGMNLELLQYCAKQAPQGPKGQNPPAWPQEAQRRAS